MAKPMVAMVMVSTKAVAMAMEEMDAVALRAEAREVALREVEHAPQRAQLSLVQSRPEAAASAPLRCTGGAAPPA